MGIENDYFLTLLIADPAESHYFYRAPPTARNESVILTDDYRARNVSFLRFENQGLL